jgi:hypothetical protein
MEVIFAMMYISGPHDLTERKTKLPCSLLLRTQLSLSVNFPSPFDSVSSSSDTERLLFRGITFDVIPTPLHKPRLVFSFQVFMFDTIIKSSPNITLPFFCYTYQNS